VDTITAAGTNNTKESIWKRRRMIVAFFLVDFECNRQAGTNKGRYDSFCKHSIYELQRSLFGFLPGLFVLRTFCTYFHDR
jgi:hypothetical protein